MAKDLYVPVTFRGNRLEAKASLGQTVIVTEGPETYTGAYEVELTGEDIVLPTKNKLMSNDLTILGEEWDGILYPADEEGRFNCKYLYLEAGDKVVVEWYGRGGRVWAFRNSGTYSANNRGNNGPNMSYSVKDYYQNPCTAHIRQELNPVEGKTIFVAAGYEWAEDGGHSGNDSYVFFGEYFKYKVIHAE